MFKFTNLINFPLQNINNFNSPAPSNGPLIPIPRIPSFAHKPGFNLFLFFQAKSIINSTQLKLYRFIFGINYDSLHFLLGSFSCTRNSFLITKTVDWWWGIYIEKRTWNSYTRKTASVLLFRENGIFRFFSKMPLLSLFFRNEHFHIWLWEVCVPNFRS